MRLKVLPLVTTYITKQAVFVRSIGDQQRRASESKALCRTLSPWGVWASRSEEKSQTYGISRAPSADGAGA